MDRIVPFDRDRYLASWRLDDDGQFEQVLRDFDGWDSRPALFLDRDGVLVEDTHHLCRVEDVRVIDGAARIIAAANTAGLPVVLITNQSGVGQGLFTWNDFLAVQVRILSELAESGGAVDAVFACPNHHEAGGSWQHDDHPRRKPNPGMLLRAASCLPIHLAGSWVVGDRWRDLEAGRRGGLAGGLYVGANKDTGTAERNARDAVDADPAFVTLRGRSIADAVDLPLFKV